MSSPQATAALRRPRSAIPLLRERFAALPLHWRVIVALLAAQAVLVALNGLNTFTLEERLFIIEEEANLPTWFSSMQFLVAALICGVAACAPGSSAAVWAPLAALMVAFSIDEVAMVHELLEEGSALLLRLTEFVAIGAALFLLAHVWRSLYGIERRLVLVAGCVLALSEAIDSVDHELDMGYVAEVFVNGSEEMLEMLVGTLVIAAAARPALGGVRALVARHEARGG
jgi:hypothetical protein